MPNSALADQAALQALFQESMSPITTYGQGLMAIAADRRRQAEQSERDKAQSALVLAREQQIEKMREASEEKLAKIHSANRIAEQTAEFNLKNEAEKKLKREEALAEARAMGIGPDKLPSNADYPTILQETAKSRGRQLIASSKAAGQAVNEYVQYRGETAMDVAKRAMARAWGTVSARELKEAKISQADVNMVMADPTKFDSLLIKAAREKNTKASALLNRVNADNAQFIETGMLDAEKTNPKLTGLAERFRLAHSAFQSLLTKGGYDEASGLESAKALVQDAFRPQQPPPAERPKPPLPGVPRGVNPIIPGAMRAVPAPATDPRFAPLPVTPMPGMGGDVNPLSGGTFPDPFAQPAPAPVAAPAVPTDPRVLSNLRLRKFLQDSAATNSTLFPTAYPPANEFNTPGAAPFSP